MPGNGSWVSFAAGEEVRCPGERFRRRTDVHREPCHARCGDVPRGTVVWARVVPSIDAAGPGSVVVACDRCHNLVQLEVLVAVAA